MLEPSHRLISKASVMVPLFTVLCLSTAGCSRYRDDLDYSYEVQQQWSDDRLVSGEIYQFIGVRYQPDSLAPLQHRIIDEASTANRRVLDLDCETGVLSLMCSQNDAKHVIALASTPAAQACAEYNLALQQAALADAGCRVEIRFAKPVDVAMAAKPLDVILVQIDQQNRDRLPGFLDAMRDGLGVGGQGMIGGWESAGDFDWANELESRGLERRGDAPEPGGDASEVDADVEAEPAASEVMVLKLRRDVSVKQETQLTE